MLGLTVTEGTKSNEIIAHSGLAVFALTPILFNSSSLIFSNLSLISIGFNLFFPTMNVLGFSSFTFSSISEQYGHFLISLAFLALCPGVNSFCFSSVSSNFPHFAQNDLKQTSIRGIYLMWKTGLASSMLPGCPGHSLTLFPQVLHLTPGSIAPNLRSINPPSTGNPSISYSSGVTIFAALTFFIFSGLSKLNFNALTCFLKNCSIIFLSPLIYYNQ